MTSLHLNPPANSEIQIQEFIKQRQLTEALDWLESRGITGFTALFVLGVYQQLQGGEAV